MSNILDINFLLEPGEIPWNPVISMHLAESKMLELGNRKILIGDESYSTRCAYLKKRAVEHIILAPGAESLPFSLELPSGDMESFYLEHGLECLTEREYIKFDVKEKLLAAMHFVKRVPQLYATILPVLKSLQALRVFEPEYDISYSHPDIPFTIFVSVGLEKTPLAALRLAESIIHESMHLYLTLLEGSVPIVIDKTVETYFSPWRQEKRPVKGVLHGLFVFSAIKDFYTSLSNRDIAECREFVGGRIADIRKEISQISSFYKNPGLTFEGKKLAVNLTQHLL
ncbi:HEXXH motif-containing putative peptide modification protein [Pedobacter sp. Leaf176]|uniref:aKG-HExxH-type peptide beta-hydroxylase n=1 Tax=Pedobacter sp. Leaf176 TaxID=1736286 RepID=UPI0006F99F67|nr:HEXXH motif-containing putative peptide modification protein [Pedobacter sp. Leaf176]KQR65328.1 hypothetical protein ASF92_20580 [Pedobacter sp. Leaf176]